jgi:hypothetical protein
MGTRKSYISKNEAALKLKSDYFKKKKYKIRIFANDDVYESTIAATRVTITNNSIVFYNGTEQIVGIYPSNLTEVIYAE